MKNRKIVITSLLLGLSGLALSGCGETTGENNNTNVYTLDGDNPTITLQGETDIRIPLGTNVILEDGDRYVATDPQDGDITAQVQRSHNIDFSQPGEYQIAYNVQDSDGNAAETKYRTVTIYGGESDPNQVVVNPDQMGYGSAPVISFTNGGDTLFLNVGEFFDRFAVTATDLEDGDLSNRVEVIGDADVYTPGTYTVTYSVTDSDGNTVTRNRTIYVGQDDIGDEVVVDGGSSDLDVFKSWYSNTCGQTFDPNLYDASTGAYNGEIKCSSRGLTFIDLTPLSIFTTIDSLDVSHNNLSSIDFNELGLEENNVKVLRELDLRYNDFSYIDFSPLHNLKNIDRLYIEGNPLNYTCDELYTLRTETFNNRSLTIDSEVDQNCPSLQN